jgi:hypothetical protein
MRHCKSIIMASIPVVATRAAAVLTVRMGLAELMAHPARALEECRVAAKTECWAAVLLLFFF